MVDALKEIPKCTAFDGGNKSRVSRNLNIGHRDIQMFPLLNDKQRRQKLDLSHTSGSDSEQEDTAFVLTQIQKSSESLARTQINPGGQSTDTELHPLNPANPESGKPEFTNE